MIVKVTRSQRDLGQVKIFWHVTSGDHHTALPTRAKTFVQTSFKPSQSLTIVNRLARVADGGPKISMRMQYRKAMPSGGTDREKST